MAWLDRVVTYAGELQGVLSVTPESVGLLPAAAARELIDTRLEPAA